MTMTLHEAWSVFSEVEPELNRTGDLAVAIQDIFRHRMNEDFSQDGYEAAMVILIKRLVENSQTAVKTFRAAAEKVADADLKERGQD